MFGLNYKSLILNKMKDKNNSTGEYLNDKTGNAQADIPISQDPTAAERIEPSTFPSGEPWGGGGPTKVANEGTRVDQIPERPVKL